MKMPLARGPEDEEVQLPVGELHRRRPWLRPAGASVSWSIIPGVLLMMVLIIPLYWIHAATFWARQMQAWPSFPYLAAAMAMCALQAWASLQARLAVRRSMELERPKITLGWLGFTLAPSATSVRSLVFERASLGMICMAEMVLGLVLMFLFPALAASPLMLATVIAGIYGAGCLMISLPILLPGGSRWVRKSPEA